MLCFLNVQPGTNTGRLLRTVNTSESTGTTRQTRLPSRFQPYTPPNNHAGSTAPKRRTSGSVGRTKTWSKDVVCIPKETETVEGETPATFSLPKGPARGKLADNGLVGKIRIVSTWSPRQVSFA